MQVSILTLGLHLLDAQSLTLFLKYFLLPRSIGPLNFSQTVDVFEGNLIGCYWSAGGPEESRGKQLPFNKVDINTPTDEVSLVSFCFHPDHER